MSFMRRRLTPDIPLISGIFTKDMLILSAIVAFLYLGVHLAIQAPAVIQGPRINLDPRFLPYYSFRSLERMAIAYVLSLFFSLIYGYAAATDNTRRAILIPLIDILQSIPILSFLPLLLLS